MRLDTYRKRKAAGSILLARKGDAHIAIVKNYDPETGLETQSEELSLDVAVLQAQVNLMAEQIKAAQELIEDLTEADFDPKPPRVKHG